MHTLKYITMELKFYGDPLNIKREPHKNVTIREVNRNLPTTID